AGSRLAIAPRSRASRPAGPRSNSWPRWPAPAPATAHDDPPRPADRFFSFMIFENVWPVLAWSAAAVALWAGAAIVLARALHRNNIVDTICPLGSVGFDAVACVVSLGRPGGPWRRGLLLGCTAIWALRLGWFVARRSAG